MRGITAKKHLVAVVVSHGVSPFELAVPCEVFGCDRSDLGVNWNRFAVCSVDAPPITTETGFTINTPYGLETVARADTVIVPALPTDEPSERLVVALRSAHRRGARIMSLCTGAFVLAAAGLLDGRRATTHWRHADEFTARFPDVKLDPAVLYVDDGNVLTSALQIRRPRSTCACTSCGRTLVLTS